MAFLSQQFHYYNKKTSCSVSGGAAVLLCQLTLELIMLLKHSVTEVTNNLDSKNFSRISILKDEILLLKNYFSEENAERLCLAIELKQLKKDF